MKNLVKRDEGFTLIEIVLVLAIAGLILLMVFLAVAGAQRSRRDTQRKQDLSRIASQLESYASNSNGVYPTTAAEITSFNNNYLQPASNWSDPLTGTQYKLVKNARITGNAATGVVDYEGSGYICTASGLMTTTGASANDYAVVMGLEQGQSCRTNGN